MRWITVLLILVVVALQYPLWFDRGGWLHVWEIDHKISEQRETNRRLLQRNSGLDAEVRDLKQGFGAIEERARYDLGMVRKGEIFVQLPETGKQAPPLPPVFPQAEVGSAGTPPIAAGQAPANTRPPASRPARPVVANPATANAQVSRPATKPANVKKQEKDEPVVVPPAPPDDAPTE